MNRIIAIFALSSLLLLASWPAIAGNPTTCPSDHCVPDSRYNAGPCGSGTWEWYSSNGNKTCCVNGTLYSVDWTDHVLLQWAIVRSDIRRMLVDFDEHPQWHLRSIVIRSVGTLLAADGSQP